MGKQKVYLTAFLELSLIFGIIDFILFSIKQGLEYYYSINNILIFIALSIALASMLLLSVSWQYKKILLMNDEELKFYDNPPIKKIAFRSIFMGLAFAVFFISFGMDVSMKDKQLYYTTLALLWFVFTFLYFTLKSYIFRFYKLMKKTEN
jgi:hypothetical protein